MKITGGKRNQHGGISASSLTPRYFICVTKPALLSAPQELKLCWDLVHLVRKTLLEDIYVVVHRHSSRL